MGELPDYGAIIYVVRDFLCFGSYHHYGVYTGNGKVVHFAPAVRNGIEEKCIHETTMNKFLDGANDYSVRYFPSSTAVLEMLVRKKQAIYRLPIHYGRISNLKSVIFILLRKRYNEHMLVLKVKPWAAIR